MGPFTLQNPRNASRQAQHFGWGARAFADSYEDPYIGFKGHWHQGGEEKVGVAGSGKGQGQKGEGESGGGNRGSDYFVPITRPVGHYMFRNVLIAEDEKSVGQLFKMILSCGLPECEIDLVNNGAEAVDAFRKGHHHILLLDLRMPVKDGYQAFQEIRDICEKEHLEMPFVVFCTGRLESAEIGRMAADPSRCRILQKPVTSELLLETLKAGLPPSS